jgi:hypothetical protein
MTEPLEGELLPAIRAPSAPASHTPEAPYGPTHRHATCHRTFRTTWAPWEAFCGVLIHSAGDLRRQDLQKCPECLAASESHAQTCDCFHLFPGARLPRP